MKAQQNTTQAAAQKQSLIQRMFRGCIRFLGTSLFIFFMTRNLLDSMGVNTLAHKELTYSVILSSFICVTIGANYWYGDRVAQWRSYCISSIIIFILYFAFLATSNSTNYPVDLLQFTVITSLPVVSTVFSIWKLRKGKKVKKDVAVSDLKRKPFKHSRALASTVRFVALISFCSVFLENAQRILLLLFDPDLAPRNGAGYNVRKKRIRLTKELKEDGKKELHSRTDYRQAAGGRTALQPGQNNR